MTFKLATAFTESSVRIAKDGVFLFDYKFRTRKVLPQISSVTILGLHGMTVRVSEVDHFQMNDPFCDGFEHYSDMLHSDLAEE